MLGFGAGLTLGFFAGIITALTVMLLVQSVPDADVRDASKVSPWRATGLVTGLLIAMGIIFALLNLKRVAFATIVMLLVVFIVARLSGMLVSWIALAIAALALCLVLPPARTLAISDRQDQILLLFFVLCGVIGTRMIAQPEKAT